MSQEELEVLRIYSEEYMDKHNHYWNVYFKFIYALILILGLLLIDAEFTKITNSFGIAILFLGLYLIFNYVAFLILKKKP